MKIIQINETDYVTYESSNKLVIGKAYIGEKYLGEVQFNMNVDISDTDLDDFTLKQAIALHYHINKEFENIYRK